MRKIKRYLSIASITVLSSLLINSISVYGLAVYREKPIHNDPDDYYCSRLANVHELDVESYYSEAYDHGFKSIYGFRNDERTTLYATEGKTLVIPNFMKDTYLKLGWSDETLITLYSLDGRTLDVTPNDKQTYLNLGWYEQPSKMLYTLDGRQEVFPESEVEAQCGVGWYTEKPVLLYTLDGREQYFPANEADAQRKVGWYGKYEIKRIAELEKIAKTFYIGEKVWKRINGYYAVGYITAIYGGTLTVKWTKLYDYNWIWAYNQTEILTAEYFTGVRIGNQYNYPADEISVYK